MPPSFKFNSPLSFKVDPASSGSKSSVVRGKPLDFILAAITQRLLVVFSSTPVIDGDVGVWAKKKTRQSHLLYERRK